MPGESPPWKPHSDRIDGKAAESGLKGLRESLSGRVVNEPFFLEQASGRRRLASMPMSDEQIKKQISYLETRIERQRAIIDGLEAEGYGGEVIRRSRVLLKQMIADLDQSLLQLREARQINVIKAGQKISSSASDASSQNSIDW